MKINKGDIILLCILFATLVLFVVNEFNILVGLPQFDGPAWTLFGVIFGGELLSFALYKVGMAKYETKDKNNAVKQIEADKKELEEMGRFANTIAPRDVEDKIYQEIVDCIEERKYR